MGDDNLVSLRQPPAARGRPGVQWLAVANRTDGLPSMDRVPRVFLSYSHDSDAHRERVLALSEPLRQDGIDTILDQYVNGTPPEGWPRWMLNGLDAADRVLVICTPTYYRRFRGHEAPDKGKGVEIVKVFGVEPAQGALQRQLGEKAALHHLIGVQQPW